MTCAHGAALREDSCPSLFALHLTHRNKQLSLKCKVLLLSLILQFQDQEHLFICNLMSAQSAQITPVTALRAGEVLLREEALQSEAHLAKCVNGRGNP